MGQYLFHYDLYILFISLYHDKFFRISDILCISEKQCTCIFKVLIDLLWTVIYNRFSAMNGKMMNVWQMDTLWRKKISTICIQSTHPVSLHIPYFNFKPLEINKKKNVPWKLKHVYQKLFSVNIFKLFLKYQYFK